MRTYIIRRWYYKSRFSFNYFLIKQVSQCEKVTKETLNFLSDIPEDYICSLCRCKGGHFDYLMGIDRLRKVGYLIKA